VGQQDLFPYLFSSIDADNAITTAKHMLIWLSVRVCPLVYCISKTAEQIFMKTDITEFIEFVDMLQTCSSQTNNELFYIKPFFVQVAKYLSEWKMLVIE
jgi:hypothetical protein